jgi:hypothetical protein
MDFRTPATIPLDLESQNCRPSIVGEGRGRSQPVSQIREV